VLAALLAGCGGAENESSLEAAAERTEAQGTGRFEVDGVQKSDEKDVAYECTGEADYGAASVHVECEYTGGVGRLDGIALDDEVYARGAYFGSGTDKWVRYSGEGAEDDSLASLSPQKLLRVLRDASSENERVGEEDVRGATTVHYRLTVDCDAARLDCRTTTPVGVWIGEDGVVRRIELEDDEGRATFEFFDFGAEVEIEPPPAADVIDEDEAFVEETGVGESGEDTHP